MSTNINRNPELMRSLPEASIAWAREFLGKLRWFWKDRPQHYYSVMVDGYPHEYFFADRRNAVRFVEESERLGRTDMRIEDIGWHPGQLWLHTSDVCVEGLAEEEFRRRNRPSGI